MLSNKEELATELNQSSNRLEETINILEGILDSDVIDPPDGEIDDVLDSGIEEELGGGEVALFAVERMLDKAIEIISEEVDNLRYLSERIEGRFE